jgi:hypothetical protein
MTLNITLLTPTAIYQSADFRLTNPSDQSLITDESAKTVVLRYMSWAGFVTYTGIGSVNGVSLSEIVADWLTGTHTPSMTDVAAILEHKGTRLIRELRRQNRALYPHSFTLAGFEENLARAIVVSNFEDCFGQTRTTDHRLTSTMIELRAGSNAAVIVTGRPKAIPSSDRRILRELAIRNPLDGEPIRSRIQELNAAASRSPESQNSVSEDCAVISFRFDGFGILQPSQTPGAGPKHIPIITDGMDLHKFMTDALANIGLDLSAAQMGNATFVSTDTPGPVGSLQSKCRFPVTRPDSSSGYEIQEIIGSDFEPMDAYDINEAGDVVGTGRDEQAIPWSRQIPWIMRGDQVSRLNFIGSAWAINNAGTMAVTPTSDGTQDAALYANGSIVALPLNGADVESIGATRSSGLVINRDGVIAGSVCTQTGHNMRAAAFQQSHAPVVLTDLVAPFGARAVDINDHGQVLVQANFGPSGIQSVVWKIEDGTWSHVGSTDNVMPIAITNSGLVLGVTSGSESLALTCEPNGTWQELGTPGGWFPKNINEAGDVVGIVMQNRLFQPWLRLATGEQFLLPFAIGHHTEARAINNCREIVGTAQTDHGGHAVIWRCP